MSNRSADLSPSNSGPEPGSGISVSPPPLRLVCRCCKTPDCSRVVGGWMLYEDVNDMYNQDDGWEIPKTPHPPPYEVRPIASKGRGLFATRKIKAGEKIIHERPILMIPHRIVSRDPDATPLERWNKIEMRLLEMLDWMEQEDREKVVQLHNCKTPEECGPLTGIARTNGMAATFPDSKFCDAYGAVCLNISYANHSCSPNAVFSFHRKLVTFTLDAERDITPGEEITITYLAQGLTRAERQAQLETKYRFTCACALCSAPASVVAASDERRRIINTTLKSIYLSDMTGTWMSYEPRLRRTKIKRTIETVEKLLRTMEEEKITDWKYRILQEGAVLYAIIADMKNFKKWARRCVEAIKDDEDKIEDKEGWESRLKSPTSFSMWNAIQDW